MMLRKKIKVRGILSAPVTTRITILVDYLLRNSIQLILALNQLSKDTYQEKTLWFGHADINGPFKLCV